MAQLITKKDGTLFNIILNRPEKFNAFSINMLDSLCDAYQLADDDPDVRCILVSASGKHFTAGLDLAEVGPAVQGGRNLQDPGKTDPFDLFGKSRVKPVVIAVKGYCFTIGIELLLASDISVAHKDTRFGQIEVQRGIMPFGGATIRMIQRMGYGNAMRYLLTGDQFSGEDAYRMGMVQELTAEDPYELAREIALNICDQAPLAVQASLANARLSIKKGEEAAIDQLMPVTRKLMDSKDAAEGLQSFVERRKARYRGE